MSPAVPGANRAMALVAGISGLRRHGCVALSDGNGLRAICEQERVTRARGAGLNPTGLPDEALDVLLERARCERADICRFVAAGFQPPKGSRLSGDRIERPLAHALAAYLPSPFAEAAVLVCDHGDPGMSLWRGRGANLESIESAWGGPGFVDLYSRCAEVIGFQGEGRSQRLEALARLRPGHRDARIDRLFAWTDARLLATDGWERVVDEVVRDAPTGPPWHGQSLAAAAFQSRLVDLVLELMADVRQRTDAPAICLGGSLFYHSSINTAIRQSGLFADVFVPIDPGEAGLAVGAALHAHRSVPRAVEPFLGPRYRADEIKETLDNCKLPYTWESDERAIAIAVDALKRGRLVAWFDGPMEWGPRALGARCILASPLSPYVLENLNRFLKRREPWRGYALSGLVDAIATHFAGPSNARFMECDYVSKDPSGPFRHALPAPGAALRVQTVDSQAPSRFQRLLAAFGEATGYPFLVNTSFNGFHEPIVCSPRDAVRVFYGTGVDLLVIEQFLLRK